MLLSIGSIIPVVMRFLGVLLAMMYFYAVLGMEFFAGKLRLDHPLVAASSYGQTDFYQSYTFDGWLESFVSVFIMLMVRKYPILMEGAMAATTPW